MHKMDDFQKKGKGKLKKGKIFEKLWKNVGEKMKFFWKRDGDCMQ